MNKVYNMRNIIKYISSCYLKSQNIDECHTERSRSVPDIRAAHTSTPLSMTAITGFETNSKVTFIILALVAVGLSSCQDVVKLDIPKDQTNKLVVDGWFYRDSTAKLQLSLSVPYFQDGETPKVSNALATLTDGISTDTLYEQNPGSGFYENKNMKGEVGKNYTLKIVSGGKEYICKTTMPREEKIDTLYPEKSAFGRPGSKPSFVATYYVVDQAGFGDQILIRYYRNDTLANNAFNLEVADDQFIDGNRVQNQARMRLESGDKVRVEIHSITKEVYNFYFQLIQLVQQQGGLFSPPPASAPSNVSNGALGVFRASTVSYKEIIVP